MPEEDGVSLLTVLQNSGFAGSIVIISGQDDWFRKSAGRLASARGLNVMHDLSKPVDLKALREILMGLNTNVPPTIVRPNKAREPAQANPGPINTVQ